VINYNYSLSPKSYTPLKNISFLKSKPLAIIRDFNFTLLPELISFSTDLTRDYTELTYRDNSGLDIDMPTTVSKSFVWNRYFNFKYSPTSALTIDFSNQNIAYIDELDGVMDEDLYPDEYELMMEEIYSNLADFGRSVDYEHTINVSYRVPINKLPFLDWTSASATYQGTYNWEASSVLADDDDDDATEVGNTLTNGMTGRLSGQLNFLTLFNKVPYFKKVNSQFQSTKRSTRSRSSQQSKSETKKDDEKAKKTKEIKYVEKKVDFKADVPKSIFHRLGTKDVKVQVFNERGDSVTGEVTIVDANRVNFKAERGLRGVKVVVTGQKEIEQAFAEKALAFTTRMLLGVRSAQLTYNRTGATVLPGFLPEPYLFGMKNDATTGNLLAPTLPFLLGWQEEGFAIEAADNDWLTQDNTVTREYLFQSSQTVNLSLQVEPISNLKIVFTGTQYGTSNESSYVNYDEDSQEFEFLNPVESGSFNMTINTLKSSFKNKVSDDYKTSTAFDEFRYTNLQVIADRLEAKRGWVDGVGYTNKYNNDTIQGVSLSSTDVIIPAFLAAYTGTDPNKIPLTERPGLSWVRPNWRVTYTGNPKNIEWMKNYIKSLSFSHSYKSTYTIGSFETNLTYDPEEDGLSWARDEVDETTFISEMTITSVTIQETLSPLISVDVGFMNDLTTRFEIDRTRNLSFSFTADQLNETIKNEYSIGLGYCFTGLDMIVKSRSKSEEISNDINMTFDLTSSSYKNTLRTIDDDDGEISGGSKVLSFDFSADYMLSDKVTVELYYQYSMSKPYTSSGYTTSTSKFGLSFNFSIL
jgi:cell surface protein SprA